LAFFVFIAKTNSVRRVCINSQLRQSIRLRRPSSPKASTRRDGYDATRNREIPEKTSIKNDALCKKRSKRDKKVLKKVKKGAKRVRNVAKRALFCT